MPAASMAPSACSISCEMFLNLGLVAGAVITAPCRCVPLLDRVCWGAMTVISLHLLLGCHIWASRVCAKHIHKHTQPKLCKPAMGTGPRVCSL